MMVPSCTIITLSPNSFIGPIHNRMPVILTEGTHDMWLDPENKELAELKEVLVPYPSAEMRVHQVATLVSKVDSDAPELIETVTARLPGPDR